MKTTSATVLRQPRLRCGGSAVWPIAVASMVVAVMGSSGVGVTGAVWADSTAIGSNSFTTTTIAAPTLISATPGCSPSGKVRVILDWNSPASGATPDGYDVYRSKTTNANYSLVGHVSSGDTTGYTDGGVQQSVTYWYKVLSTRGSWTSAFSNELSALTPDICF